MEGGAVGAGRPRSPQAPPAGTLLHDSVRLGILQVGDTQTVRWLGTFPNVVFYPYDLPPGGPVARTMSVYTLGPTLVFTGTSDARVWIGHGGSDTIAVYDTTGSLVDRVVFPLKPRPFDLAALDEARERALSGLAEPGRSGVEALYAEDIRPPTAPLFTRFIAGPGGEVWVECYAEIATAAHCAIVLDRNGHAIGRATVPQGLGIRAVDRERVVGVRTDADGVQTVAVHRLRRSG